MMRFGSVEEITVVRHSRTAEFREMRDAVTVQSLAEVAHELVCRQPALDKMLNLMMEQTDLQCKSSKSGERMYAAHKKCTIQ